MSRKPQLTLMQHVHSAAAIERFGDATRGHQVQVLYRDPSRRSHPAHPRDAIFCAKRAWDEAAEGRVGVGRRTRPGFFRPIEDGFQRECDAIVELGIVRDHEAVSAYASIWIIRSMLADERLPDVALEGIKGGSSPSPEAQVVLEKKGYKFLVDGKMPSRFLASMRVPPLHDWFMASLRPARWGIIRAGGRLGFICPDRPPQEHPCIPLDRRRLLIAHPKFDVISVDDDDVQDFNQSSFDQARAFVFGHRDDIEAFRTRGTSEG